MFFLVHTDYSWKLTICKFTSEISTNFSDSVSYRPHSLMTMKFNQKPTLKKQLKIPDSLCLEAEKKNFKRAHELKEEITMEITKYVVQKDNENNTDKNYGMVLYWEFRGRQR